MSRRTPRPGCWRGGTYAPCPSHCPPLCPSPSSTLSGSRKCLVSSEARPLLGGREMVAKPGCHGNTVAAAPAAGEVRLSMCRLVRSALPRPGAKTVAFVCSWLLACEAGTRAVAPSSGRLSPGNPRLAFLTTGWTGCSAATVQARERSYSAEISGSGGSGNAHAPRGYVLGPQHGQQAWRHWAWRHGRGGAPPAPRAAEAVTG